MLLCKTSGIRFDKSVLGEAFCHGPWASLKVLGHAGDCWPRRMKRPDCSLPVPFLRVVLEASHFEGCNNNSPKSRLASACYKNGKLSSTVSLAVMQTYCIQSIQPGPSARRTWIGRWTVRVTWSLILLAVSWVLYLWSRHLKSSASIHDRNKLAS